MGGVRGHVAQCVGNRANFNRIGIVGRNPRIVATSRQRQLLNQELPVGQWTVDAIADAAQWKGLLLRWNASKGVYERLLDLSGAFGRGWATDATTSGARTRDWPAAHPLSEGTVLRLSIPNSGMYRIDRAWMIDAGFDPDTIDPRNVHVFGNGGTLLPMDNSKDRPLGLRTVAADFAGSEDGSWDDGDELIFGAGSGLDWLESAAASWEHLRHPYEDKAWYFLPLIRTRRPHHPCSCRDRGAGYGAYALHKRAVSRTGIGKPEPIGREWFGEIIWFGQPAHICISPCRSPGRTGADFSAGCCPIDGGTKLLFGVRW